MEQQQVVEQQALGKLRQQIDSIDDQIIELLGQRMEVVRQVGLLKKQHQTAIYRPEREKAIIDRLEQYSGDLLNRSAIEAIYQEIFAVSRNLELPEKVAYLGPEGSFTHQAAASRFGTLSDYLPFKTIRSVFDNVETGRARFGVVPIENNREGSVVETIDMLCTRDVKIVAELPMAVHFTLASLQDHTHNIKRIYSKDIAFRQCQGFLSEYFGEEVELIEVESTSKAARLASEQPDAAALCSGIAAKLYGLPVLYDNIEDSEDNTTRFLIIAKDMVNQASGEDKTTILAKLPHRPGGLAQLLEEFRSRDINLTSIQSRPARIKESFKYWFIIDFEGYHQDAAVQEIFSLYGEDIAFLGSYVKLV